MKAKLVLQPWVWLGTNLHTHRLCMYYSYDGLLLQDSSDPQSQTSVVPQPMAAEVTNRRNSQAELSMC